MCTADKRWPSLWEGGGWGGGGDICVLPIKGSHMRNGEGRGGGGVGGSRVLQVKCRLRREEGSRY